MSFDSDMEALGCRIIKDKYRVLYDGDECVSGLDEEGEPIVCTGTTYHPKDSIFDFYHETSKARMKIKLDKKTPNYPKTKEKKKEKTK